jgi:hypothetical protein
MFRPTDGKPKVTYPLSDMSTFYCLGKPQYFWRSEPNFAGHRDSPGKKGGIGFHILWSVVLWEYAPCSLVCVYQRLGWTVNTDSPLLCLPSYSTHHVSRQQFSHIQSSYQLNSCVFFPVSLATGGVSIWEKRNCRCIHDNGSLGRGLLHLIQWCSHTKGVSPYGYARC